MVINVSSGGARVVSAGPAHYNVAKAALNALTKVIADHIAGPDPHWVWTDPDGLIGRIARLHGSSHEDFVQQMTDCLGASTGRVSTPEEVASIIAFLASPNNINGAEYLIDGGIIKHL